MGDTNAKIRDYDRGSKRTVDYDAPKTNGVVVDIKPISNGTNRYSTTEMTNITNNYTKPTTNGVTITNDATETKRGSWRKDMEKYEDQLSKQKHQATTKIEASRNVIASSAKTVSTSSSIQSSSIQNSQTNTTTTGVTNTPSWKKPETTVKVQEQTSIKTENKYTSDVSKTTSSYSLTTSETKKDDKTVEPKSEISTMSQVSSIKSATTTAPLSSKDSTTATSKENEQEKQVPKWKKPEASKTEENKTVSPPSEPEKQVPKWKKPAATKKEESTLSQQDA